MRKTFVVFIGLLLFLIQASAQSSDSLKIKGASDSTLQKKHSPKKAAAMSALIPGLGQAYNKKYWKIPVIYGGFAGLGIALSATHKNYVAYRDAYKYRIDTLSSTVDDFTEFSTENLNTLQDQYHKRRDLLTIGIGVLYFLNIIDAAVDAHLFYFDVSDELSMQIQPYIETPIQANRAAKGITLTLKF